MNKIKIKILIMQIYIFNILRMNFGLLKMVKLKMEVTQLIKELELEVLVMKKLHLLIQMISH